MNINDLPKDTAISRDELKEIRGGFATEIVSLNLCGPPARTGTFATEIVSMSLSGSSTQEPVPTEEITLNYT